MSSSTISLSPDAQEIQNLQFLEKEVCYFAPEEVCLMQDIKISDPTNLTKETKDHFLPKRLKLLKSYLNYTAFTTENKKVDVLTSACVRVHQNVYWHLKVMKISDKMGLGVLANEDIPANMPIMLLDGRILETRTLLEARAVEIGKIVNSYGQCMDSSFFDIDTKRSIDCNLQDLAKYGPGTKVNDGGKNCNATFFKIKANQTTILIVSKVVIKKGTQIMVSYGVPKNQFDD